MLGSFATQLATLRCMSIAVTARLARGESPIVEAALVKDIGTEFEQAIPALLEAAISADPAQRDRPRALSHGGLPQPDLAHFLAARRHARGAARHDRARSGLALTHTDQKGNFMFTEAIEAILRDRARPDAIRASENGSSGRARPAVWSALEEAGFLELLAPEDARRRRPDAVRACADLHGLRAPCAAGAGRAEHRGACAAARYRRARARRHDDAGGKLPPHGGRRRSRAVRTVRHDCDTCWRTSTANCCCSMRAGAQRKPPACTAARAPRCSWHRGRRVRRRLRRNGRRSAPVQRGDSRGGDRRRDGPGFRHDACSTATTARSSASRSASSRPCSIN